MFRRFVPPHGDRVRLGPDGCRHRGRRSYHAMLIIFAGFLVSLLATLLIVRSSHTHAHLSNDHDFSGPQKFHARPVPRIGGVGILAGVLTACAVLSWRRPDLGASIWLVLLSALPAFGSGVAEDVTKNVSPKRRLLFTALAACLAAYLVDGVLSRTGIPGFDALLAWPWVAVAFTVFLVSGITNAVNIIDGFNGLAAMCVMMMLAAIGYVAFQVQDWLVLYLALACIGAVGGFFIWNFPAGLIFLGDGGAYFLGFMVAELSILLLQRNPTVSPMFGLLVCAYPVVETLFSIYRKRFIRKMSPGIPDGVHLHMLVYKRLMRWMVGQRDARALTQRNSLTSPYLWALCMASVIPAVLFWDSTPILFGFVLLFALTYVLIYWRIVRFKAPKWLVRRRAGGQPPRA